MKLNRLSALLGCAASLGSLSVAAAGGKAMSLPEAQASIEANLRTAEGKTFDERLGKEFVDKRMMPLGECKTSAGNDLASFWILPRLDKDSGVEELLLHPETKWAPARPRCLPEGQVLAAPGPDY